MFTGIVQGLGRVLSVQDRSGIRRLQVDLPIDRRENLEVGQSIAINGVCLTLAQHTDQGHAHFDVIDETLRLTNLGRLNVAEHVNVERAARFGDEIGGHMLSGHIHGLATVNKVVECYENLTVHCMIPEALRKYVFPKGYVSLNGCSLTVGERQDMSSFSIHLIPETRRSTTFGSVSAGDLLNLEVDAQTQAIVETVEQILEKRQ